MRLATIAVLIAALWASPATADELDDRVALGVNCYADNCPQCGSWMEQLFRELREDADPTSTLTVSTIKAWMIANQRQDGNVVRDERMGTLAHTMQTVVGAMAAQYPARHITADEYLTRVERYLKIKYPRTPVPVNVPARRNDVSGVVE